MRGDGMTEASADQAAGTAILEIATLLKLLMLTILQTIIRLLPLQKACKI